MTENKRYYTKLNPQNHYEIYDSQDKYEKFYPYNKETINKICDLLNELSNENKQLKKDIEFSDKKQNEFFKKWNDSMNENFRLKQENEQLKEKNKKLRHDLNVLRRGVFGD